MGFTLHTIEVREFFSETLLKSIGEVEGGADTVLDVFIEYMEEGLLVFPTHTWSYINSGNPTYYVDESPSCVGVLTDLFRKRPGVNRSWHPTHSVAALGKDAEAFTTGDEKFDTPCARGSVWGKLLDRKAQIMLVGVDLKRNTFIHGVEEWLDIPGRLTDTHEQLYTVLSDGTEILVPSRRHNGVSSSLHFWKVEEVLVNLGALCKGQFGNAEVLICDTVKMTEILFDMLNLNPKLFSDNEPITDHFKVLIENRWKARI
ncbi:AAC(3) family N-acetyltransferase [Anaerobacillus alkalilacustris]|uniref:Aminoglycoside N(3)-acetyltransferase n=1 Tax=Anaerobacillus alkalilacustris TaxID=393763 RepID=A0A1S2LFZ0_9BACI|nr:AAC(3) family N-acetyltransferase [Anaerobacillus alkalilacustris]OIJ11286.1 AAC(3) family N-acetyltransferase [Anaerobacillus alkalilacustris]